jgi:hypothetical protein
MILLLILFICTESGVNPLFFAILPSQVCERGDGADNRRSEALFALSPLGSECWPAAQWLLYSRNPKQTKTLARIIKPLAIFTPAMLLKALAHEYIFIFCEYKCIYCFLICCDRMKVTTHIV